MNRNRKDKGDRQPVKLTPQQCLLAIQNIRFARRRWDVSRDQIDMLKDLTAELGLSVCAGHLKLIDNNWYVTHAGLLRVARRSQCSGIRVHPLREYSDPASGRWVFKAIVHKSPQSRGFVGYGDADPSNVSSLVHGAEMRCAETRAVNRALRKAYGIALCSVEELGSAPRCKAPEPPYQPNVPANGNNGHHNTQPRLRDRLCLLMRQYQLDADLVKAYAADFCGTTSLRDAKRDQIEAFIDSLAESAAKDRDALICKLNRYAKQPEVSS
jgi:hypothetical protein